ncbi:MAG TPA: mannosyltransferase family protein, partial [Acidimicrobiales bacterium]
MATTTEDYLNPLPGTAAPTSATTAPAPPEPPEESPSADGSQRSNVWVVTWITLSRLGIALLLSALTERAAPVGTAGSAVRGPASGFLNWDGAHYLAIAEHGYRAAFDAPFFPAQPLIAHTLGAALGYPNADIAVSWIAFAFAVWGIVDLASRFTTRRAAIAAALLFAWNPVSIFLVSGYAESLVIALSVWSLRFCLDRRWLSAALLAGVASAVIPQGAVAGVVVVCGIVLAERGVRRVLSAVCYGVIAEAGLIGYLLYSRAHFGDAFEFEKAASTLWQNHLTYPFHSVFFDVQAMEKYSSP